MDDLEALLRPLRAPIPDLDPATLPARRAGRRYVLPLLAAALLVSAGVAYAFVGWHKPAPVVAEPECRLLVYKAEWCAVCQNLIAYLDERGATYETRDIDDPGNADAMASTAAQGDIDPRIPITVVNGGEQIVQGFEASHFDALLAD